MSQMQFRFGTLQAAEVKTAQSGVQFMHYMLQAPTFKIYGVVFDAGLIAALAEVELGTEVRVGGFFDEQTKEDKTYRSLVARYVKIGDAEALLAKKVAAADEEISGDDFTTLKGVGVKAAAELQKLGFLTFAQLAETTDEQRAVLDEQMPGIRGNLARNKVFEQAAELAAA